MRSLCQSLLTALALLVACESSPEPAPPRAAEKAPPAPGKSAAAGVRGPATYVGRARCVECHAAQATAHAGSQHDLALQEAIREAVAAPFAGEAVKAAHVEARFVQAEGRFVVEGARRWPVKWTLGVEPLQQVLVEAERGRVQAFPAPFDTRPKAAGGQRWYMQPELDVPAGDALHWQGLAMNWNQSCADCHSTHLQKRYSLEEDRYDTTFAEPDVSCEACHGPASRHVALAQADPKGVATPGGAGFERKLVPADTRRWVREAGEPIAHLEGVDAALLGPAHATDELDACARCHSRRSDFGGESLRFHDRYRLQLLEPPYYFADGQIREEVYVYGSFLQSAMYRAGVTCSDCHDPHTTELRAEPQALCAGCHDPARFDVPAHHMHPGAGAPRCVDCHMPERTYMGVDGRRDHRLGVPRPDLAAALEAPNACRACHAERSDGWLAAAIAKTHGPERPATPWLAVAAIESRPDEAAQRAVAALVADPSQSPLVRASALVRWSLAAGPSGALMAAITGARDHVDPLLRRAAAEASRVLPAELRIQAIAPLWKDRRRVVRIEAAMAHLEGAGPRAAPQADAADFMAALREAGEARRFEADTPQGLLALAAIDLRLGERARAMAAFERAAERFPHSPVVFANWADALRATGDEATAGQVLERGLKQHPESGALHHARGLWLVRQGRRQDALAELERAVALAGEDDRARFEYVYEVAKRDLGAGAGGRPPAP